METWFVLVVSVCLAALIRAFLSLKPQAKLKLPPGPLGLPILSGLKWLGATSTDLEAYLRKLRPELGPIITLTIGTRHAIFVSSHELAHQALVQKGAIFADRPSPTATAKIASVNQHNISSAGYGPTWRTLRRNLTSQILHPSRVKDYSHARKWVLDILMSNLSSASDSNVKVVDHFQFAMFCLLVLMCFGDKLDEAKIREVEKVQRSMLVSFTKFQILNFWPRLTRVLLRKRWELFFTLRKRQQQVLSPLIKARKDIIVQGGGGGEKPSTWVTSYVDTLLNLEVEDDENGGGKRRLNEEELISACSEFLTAGTDTTSTALQWIMANLVKYPDIQVKLFEEIRGVVAPEVEEVAEEELPKMPYLKAVVLEGLRRHPPAHFLLPHTVSEDVELGGYVVAKNTIVNFTVAEMGWDSKVWEDPMAFKPERFLASHVEFDITGSREIKMMPFGVGRRICPGFGLAILHLEYFVANLVWKFKWTAAEGHEVDLSEKQEFTIVMKHPLNARISPRHLS